MRASLKRSLVSAAFALAALSAAAPQAMASADQQFFPLATYRVGAYASSGVQVWAGMIDYLRYINEVEGGINGVKLVWQECETEWTAEKGIECYERFKNGLDARRSRCTSPTARRPPMRSAKGRRWTRFR